MVRFLEGRSSIVAHELPRTGLLDRSFEQSRVAASRNRNGRISAIGSGHGRHMSRSVYNERLELVNRGSGDWCDGRLRR